MKLFDLDWLDFFQRLGLWDRLALSTRQVLAELKSNMTVSAEEFGGDLQRLTDAGFVTVSVDRQRAKLHKDCLSFARAIRAMCRHDILEQPDARVLYNYILDHYTHAEQAALSPDGRSYHCDAHDLLLRALNVGHNYRAA